MPLTLVWRGSGSWAGTENLGARRSEDLFQWPDRTVPDRLPEPGVNGTTDGRRSEPGTSRVESGVIQATQGLFEFVGEAGIDRSALHQAGAQWFVEWFSRAER